MRGVSVLRGAVRAVRPRSPGTPTYLQNPAPELGESRSHHSTVMRVFEGEVFWGGHHVITITVCCSSL